MQGNPFYRYPFSTADEAFKSAVWDKGRQIAGFDPRVWRHDICGNVMRYGDHGNTDSQYGWEIDHVVPEARGGRDVISNLQPLQWSNNRKKGDEYPWSCGA